MIEKLIEEELSNIRLRKLNQVLIDTKEPVSTAITDMYALENEEPDRILIDVMSDTTAYAKICVRLIFNNRIKEQKIFFKIRENGEYHIYWFDFYIKICYNIYR